MKQKSYLVLSFVMLILLSMLGGCSGGEGGGVEKTAAGLSEGRIGVMTGSTGESFAEEAYPNAQVQKFDNIADAFAALQGNKLDYVITAQTTALNYVKAAPMLKVLPDRLIDEKISIALSKDNPGLRDSINSVLAKFEEDGTLERVISNWIREDGSSYLIEDIPKCADGKTLRVAIAANREPMCFVMDNVYRGLDCELIERIAYELDMRVEYSDMQFSALITALQSGKADVVISNLTETPERAQKVNFTTPYFYNPQVAVVKKLSDGSNVDLTKLSDLEGKTVATYSGSVFFEVINQKIPNVNHLFFNDMTSVTEAVRAGKADALATDEPVARLIVSKDPQLKIMEEKLLADEYGMAFRKGDPLRDKANVVLKEMADNGTLKQITEKWTGADESAKVIEKFDDKPDFDGSAGTLRVGHDTVMEPMCYVAEGGEAKGLEIDLIHRIAYELNMKLELVPMDFSSLIAALTSGKVDMVAGSMSITEERKKSVDFTDTYYKGGMVFVVRDEAAVAEKYGFFEGIAQSFYRTFVVENRYQLILQGLGVTLLISILAGVLGTVLGFLLCMLRRSRFRAVDRITKAFVRLVQGTPVVVILMILYYIVFGKSSIHPVAVAVIGFAVNFAVYVSEMMKTGIDAVDKGQIEAANAMGFSRSQVFLKIVLPQATRHVLPVFQGEFISMIKMTSVVGYIAIQDLTKMSDIIRSRTFESFFPLISTALIYFLISYGLTALMSVVELKIDPKRRKRVIKGVRCND